MVPFSFPQDPQGWYIWIGATLLLVTGYLVLSKFSKSNLKP